jgi:hypothetical protein
MEVATVQLFPGWEPIDDDSTVDAQEHCEHGFCGRYRMHHFCQNLIERYKSYLPMIVAPQKPRVVTSHNITEADSLLSFKHPE